jgi:hypothetical protein
VLFEDLVCQLHDMVQPGQEGAYTLRDFKRMSTTAGTLFNALFNLHKVRWFEDLGPSLGLRGFRVGCSSTTLSLTHSLLNCHKAAYEGLAPIRDPCRAPSLLRLNPIPPLPKPLL